jgi:hypothetical protein
MTRFLFYGIPGMTIPATMRYATWNTTFQHTESNDDAIRTIEAHAHQNARGT